MNIAEAQRGENTATVRPAWVGLWGTDVQGPYMIASVCGHCGMAALGLRSVCPKCFATEAMTEHRVGRTGVLYTATRIHQTPSGFDVPYRVGYVDIEHGLRVFAHVASDVDIGAEVSLTLRPVRADTSGDLLEGPVYCAANRD